jgi:tetratricopeptide (TPR) repeat protein
MLTHDHVGAIDLGEEALALSKSFDLPESTAHTLISIGVARWWNGDREGAADVQRGLDVALERNSLPIARRGYTNLAMIAGGQGQPARRLDLLRQSDRISQRLGDRHMHYYVAAQIAWEQSFADEWEAACRFADEFIAECDAGTQHVQEAGMRLMRARIRLARDDERGAIDDLERALSITRAAGGPEWMGDLGDAMMISFELGLVDEARALAAEIRSFGSAAKSAVVALSWYADRLGLSRIDLEPLLDEMSGDDFWRRLAKHLLTDFAEAADLLAEIGYTAFEADARRRAAATLVERGRYEEAKEQIDRALSFYRSVGATRHIREVEALLASIHSTVG